IIGATSSKIFQNCIYLLTKCQVIVFNCTTKEKIVQNIDEISKEIKIYCLENFQNGNICEDLMVVDSKSGVAQIFGFNNNEIIDILKIKLDNMAQSDIVPLSRTVFASWNGEEKIITEIDISNYSMTKKSIKKLGDYFVLGQEVENSIISNCHFIGTISNWGILYNLKDDNILKYNVEDKVINRLMIV
ncbi:MAG: hypothetical protein MHPSP_001939, partial [Paramarteilia canceri]